MEFIATDKAPAAIGPYAQAVKVGDWLYTSGQIPLTPEGELAGDDIEFANKTSVQKLEGGVGGGRGPYGPSSQSYRVFDGFKPFFTGERAVCRVFPVTHTGAIVCTSGRTAKRRSN